MAEVKVVRIGLGLGLISVELISKTIKSGPMDCARESC